MKIEVKEYIIKRLNFLKEFGYTFEQHIRTSAYSDEKIEELWFISDKIKIEISYNEYVDCKHVDILVESCMDNSNFSIEEYLIYIGKTKLSTKGNLDLEDIDYLKEYFDLFNTLLDQGLLEIIKGESWPSISKDYK